MHNNSALYLPSQDAHACPETPEEQSPLRDPWQCQASEWQWRTTPEAHWPCVGSLDDMEGMDEMDGWMDR